MSGVLGMIWWVLLVVVILVLGAVIAYRLRSKRGRDADGAEPGEARTPAVIGRRLAVLESAAIDATRRLVLVRCDDAEHLIVVGGSVDLIVEQDIGKSRAAGAAARPGMPEPALRRLAGPQAPGPSAEPAPRAPAVGLQSADSAEAQKAAPAENAERAARPNLTAVPAPARGGRPSAPPVPAVRSEAAAREAPRAPLVAPPPRPEQKAAPARPANGAGRGAELKPALPVRPAPAQPAPAQPAPMQAAQVQAAPVQGGPAQSTPLQSPEKPLPRGIEEGPRQEAPAALARPASPAPLAATRNDEAQQRRVLASVQDNHQVGGNRRAAENVPPGADLREPARDAQPQAPAAPDATWPEADGIEGEIGRALRIQENAAPADDAPHSPPAPRVAAEQRGPTQPATTNPATTLGDLAERLEEALAREVKASNQNRGHLDLDLDGFGFEGEAQGAGPAPAQPQAAPEPARGEQNRAEPQRAEPQRAAARPIAPAPEPERREARAQAERQEEAPVINLHARRREAADPLEDEMARLLGELTGDSNRR